MPELFHIRCTIERGGFSSERTFEITLADGSKLVGTAFIQYLCDENQNPLSDDEPAYGVKINGFVKCKKLRSHGKTVVVEVPSADVVDVAEEALV